SGSMTTAGGDGAFRFGGLAVSNGSNPLTTTVEDAAGNRATFTLSITKIDTAVDPVGGDNIVLAEGAGWLAQQAVLIDLRQDNGSRRLRFNVSASFDTTDADV